MEEYKHKLNAKFIVALTAYLKVHTSQDVGGFLLDIKDVIRVFPEPDLRSIKIHVLTNGDEQKINFSGMVIVEHKAGDDRPRKKVNFKCNQCPVKWDSQTEDFTVGLINDFVTSGFARF